MRNELRPVVSVGDIFSPSPLSTSTPPRLPPRIESHALHPLRLGKQGSNWTNKWIRARRRRASAAFQDFIRFEIGSLSRNRAQFKDALLVHPLPESLKIRDALIFQFRTKKKKKKTNNSISLMLHFYSLIAWFYNYRWLILLRHSETWHASSWTVDSFNYLNFFFSLITSLLMKEQWTSHIPITTISSTPK